jgi:hypothetical protein
MSFTLYEPGDMFVVSTTDRQSVDQHGMIVDLPGYMRKSS